RLALQSRQTRRAAEFEADCLLERISDGDRLAAYFGLRERERRTQREREQKCRHHAERRALRIHKSDSFLSSEVGALRGQPDTASAKNHRHSLIDASHARAVAAFFELRNSDCGFSEACLSSAAA